MSLPVLQPQIAGLGTPEIIIILAILILLFGASKLPELARGSGRALRIFKAETKGLMDDDEDSDPAKTQAQLELEAKQRDLAARQAELDAEAQRLDEQKLNRGDTV
jgi:sec-independent protein translocase protein TatA